MALRNRIVSTAHAEVYAEPGGLPGDRYIRYYEEKAKGGLGLAICGGSSPVSIDSPAGLVAVGQPARPITSSNPLSRLAEAMHRHGMKIMIQATHMGRRSALHGEHWPHLVAPSGVREPVHRGNAKTIEIEDIRRIIRDFAAAAKRVQGRGHGRHRDLGRASATDRPVLEPAHELPRRTSGAARLENRMRFGVEVLKAVREAVGRGLLRRPAHVRR